MRWQVTGLQCRHQALTPIRAPKKWRQILFINVDQLISSRFRNKVRNFGFVLCFGVMAQAKLGDIESTAFTV